MNITIAKQWAAELRSGKWEQGAGALNRNGKLCCLGALCEMAVEAGLPVATSEIKSHNMKTFDAESGVVPDSILEWAGLKTPYGYFGVNPEETIEDGCTDYLTIQNDQGATFPEIADLIEKHAEAL